MEQLFLMTLMFKQLTLRMKVQMRWSPESEMLSASLAAAKSSLWIHGPTNVLRGSLKCFRKHRDQLELPLLEVRLPLALGLLVATTGASPSKSSFFISARTFFLAPALAPASPLGRSSSLLLLGCLFGGKEPVLGASGGRNNRFIGPGLALGLRLTDRFVIIITHAIPGCHQRRNVERCHHQWKLQQLADWGASFFGDCIGKILKLLSLHKSSCLLFR